MFGCGCGLDTQNPQPDTNGRVFGAQWTDLGELAEGRALVVAHRVGLDVAALGLVQLLQLHVHVGERHDEARVVGPEQEGLLVVVQAVRVRLEDLVGLAEAVPGPVVLRVEFCQ